MFVPILNLCFKTNAATKITSNNNIKKKIEEKNSYTDILYPF